MRSFRVHRAILEISFCTLLIGALPREANAATEVRRIEFSMFASNQCPAAATCSVSLGSVPANRAWLIKYVSCYVRILNVNGKVLYWYLSATRDNFMRVGEIQLRPTSLGTTATEHTYNATEQSYLRVPSGATIDISMARDGSTNGAIPNMQCTIGGDNIVLQ
jgi:hypothetical protein